jgi:cytochrome c553
MRRALIILALLWFGLTTAKADYCRVRSGQERKAGRTRILSSGREAGGSAPADPPGFRPNVPQAWDEGRLINLQVPLADARYSPVEVPWDYYYRIRRRLIYKSYPVYAPGREPAGYFDWLKQQKPQVIWGVGYDGESHMPPLETEADWIKAGEIVFDAAIAYDTDPWGTSVVSVDDVRSPAWYASIKAPVGRDGVLPFTRYVIRNRGVVELGEQSCGMCHTRVLKDGTVVRGAQGNFPFDRAAAARLDELDHQSSNQDLLPQVRKFLESSFAAPWLHSRSGDRLGTLSLDEIADALRAIPPGMTDRSGSSLFQPVQTPDLIGLEARRYLDHTGLVQQRSIGDLMTYASLNQDVGGLGRYGGFVPEGRGSAALPDPMDRARYSDEQLYALALYLYSLQPPPNPNTFDARAARGQQVFAQEGCARCHTPPLYTNNRLTPAEGFTLPADILKDFSILPVSLHTDPALALGTRRGTGLYKVPSLRGVWYRGMFPHDGSCASLEDWFNPRRLSDDYVPTGFKGYGITHRSVPGHEYGLDLSAEDKAALIAFLKTL